MNNKFAKVIALLLALTVLAGLAGCGPKEEAQVDGPALLKSILEQVAFTETLSDVGDSAALYFPDLPADAKVQMYGGSGYYAEELALITLAKESDAAAAQESVQTHLQQLRQQFSNYIPAEVTKIDKAIVYHSGVYILMCVGGDTNRVNEILAHASDPSYRLPAQSDKPQPSQSPVTTDPKSTNPPAPTDPSKPAVDPAVPTRPDGYPAITSQSTDIHKYSSGVIRVDHTAFDVGGYNVSTAGQYAKLVNKAADALAGKVKVYCMPIPTSIGIVFPDNLQDSYAGYRDQGADIQDMLSKMSSNVIPVDCYDNLMRHRNEEVYFRTDYHWNGPGAYYGYEAFCKVKGFTPYTMDQREERQFPGYLGPLYRNNSNQDPVLAETPDTVYAYLPYCKTATMVIHQKDGTTMKWPIISDQSKSEAKYSTFAGADQPLAVFTNPEVTDGSVLVVVKESFGNALMPYLVDHYSTVYEVDYRYWSGDLVKYTQEVGADDLLFANNMGAASGSLSVGWLSKIIP